MVKNVGCCCIRGIIVIDKTIEILKIIFIACIESIQIELFLT